MIDENLIKDSTSVGIGRGRLSIPMYIDGEITIRQNYSLIAAINHTGPFKRGHYKTYVKNKCKRWWLCNDRFVQEVKFEEIDTCNIYVLLC